MWILHQQSNVINEFIIRLWIKDQISKITDFSMTKERYVFNSIKSIGFSSVFIGKTLVGGKKIVFPHQSFVQIRLAWRFDSSLFYYHMYVYRTCAHALLTTPPLLSFPRASYRKVPSAEPTSVGGTQCCSMRRRTRTRPHGHGRPERTRCIDIYRLLVVTLSSRPSSRHHRCLLPSPPLLSKAFLYHAKCERQTVNVCDHAHVV